MSSKGRKHSKISEDEIITQRLMPGRFDEFIRPEKFEPDSPVVEIDLNKLCAADEIMFETTHSVYSFTVTDPRIPAGKLIGGVLGNRLVDAALVPTRVESSRSKKNHKKLKAGSKFVFLIECGDGLRRLTTSRVTILQHRKKGRQRRLIACPRAVTLEHVSNDKADK